MSQIRDQIFLPRSDTRLQWLGWRNFIRRSDSYKYTHWQQYPPGTTHLYAYMESRGGRFPDTVFFGLQYYLLEYLSGRVICREMIDDAEQFCNRHFGAKVFNRTMWQHILTEHDGRLPLRIRAVPEGTVVPVGNVLMTVENTDPICYSLTNFVETMLLKTWYPITVATQSRAIKALILRYLEDTGDPKLIDFKLHDFGYRGVSSEESAAIGAAAHLVNFKGSDTVIGVGLLEDYYDALPSLDLASAGMLPKDFPRHGSLQEPCAAYSIPAAEHSTISSWGEERELDAYRNMLEKFPDGLVAVVSDTWDIFRAVEKIWPALKNEVLARNGVLVIRPDSGAPKDIVLEVCQKLAERFGAEQNAKGYEVLHPKVRVIQGDGINLFSIEEILENLKRSFFSADNVAFGMGGALLQQVNRDTQKFAFKASCVTIDGVDHDVWKKPVTDSTKSSKPGRLALVHKEDGTWETRKDPLGNYPNDQLVTVFENGQVTKHWTLPEIRARAKTGPRSSRMVPSRYDTPDNTSVGQNPNVGEEKWA